MQIAKLICNNEVDFKTYYLDRKKNNEFYARTSPLLASIFFQKIFSFDGQLIINTPYFGLYSENDEM